MPKTISKNSLTQQQIQQCLALIRLRDNQDFQHLLQWLSQQCQWQIPDPKQAKSLDTYALEAAGAYNYSKCYSDIMNYLQNQDEILKQYRELEKQEEENATTDKEWRRSNRRNSGK